MATNQEQLQVYVPVRPICDYLGLSWSGQRERINRDSILASELRFVRVTRTKQGGNPDLLCLPLELLPGWLFGVDYSRVKAALRDKFEAVMKFLADWHQAANTGHLEGPAPIRTV